MYVNTNVSTNYHNILSTISMHAMYTSVDMIRPLYPTTVTESSMYNQVSGYAHTPET